MLVFYKNVEFMTVYNITEKDIAKISKTLSYVLRHRPHEIGIVPDENGKVVPP
jgi:RNA:NAD 2'-phosphotransferase (TPT1/KptA family)